MTMLGIAGPKPPGPKYGQPVLPNLNVRQICPNCQVDPPNIIEEYSKGDLVCSDCGTILGDRIVDTRSEWRTFAGDESGDDPSRVGDAGNPLLGSNLDTVISGRDGNTGLSRDLQRAQNRANAQNVNGKSSTVNLQQAFARIAEKCDYMQLPPNVTQRAQHVFKIADDYKLVKGGRYESVLIAACIVFASRDGQSRRTFAEVCKATGVGKKELGQVFLQVKSAVNQYRASTGAATAHNSGNSNMLEIVEDLLSCYCNYLDIDHTVLNGARYIAKNAVQKTDIDARNSASIASAVLLLTCILFGKPLSPKDLSAQASISDSTIKLVCKKIAVKLDEVIRPEWKEMYPKGYRQLAGMAQVNENVGISRGGTPKPEIRSGTPKATTPTSDTAPDASANGDAKVENGVNGKA